MTDDSIQNRETIADLGAGPVQPRIVVPGTTTGAAPIVPVAKLDVAALDELLSHETVLASGEIEHNAKVDTTIFSVAVAPRLLSSNQAKSRIAHIAEMYMQWQGEIEFRLYITKAIFQQTKIVIAFVPTAIPKDPKYTALQLLGFHNRVVVNPSNDSEAIFPVPFIAKGNWLGTQEMTGYLVAKLLQPIVVTQASNTNIPWTLAVAARPNRLRFRYIIPPPLVTVAGDPSSQPNSNNNLGDTPVRGARQILQRQVSQVQRDQGERSVPTPLRFPFLSHQPLLQCAIIVPMPYLSNLFDLLMLKKVLPEGNANEVKNPFLNLVGPATSFENSLHLTVPSAETLYPCLLPQRPIVLTKDVSSWHPVVLDVYMAVEGVYHCHLYVQQTPGEYLFTKDSSPTLHIFLAGKDLGLPGSSYEFSGTYSQTETHGVTYTVWYLSCDTKVSSASPPTRPKEVSLLAGSPSFTWTDEALKHHLENLMLLQAETKRIPKSLDSIVIYTDASLEEAQAMASVIASPRAWTPVFNYRRLSFTCVQGAALFSDARCMFPDQKAPSWSLYEWTVKSRDTPIAQIFKSSDHLLDYAKTRIMNPDSAPLAVEIAPASESSWRYVRDCNPDDAETDALRVYVVPPPLVRKGLLVELADDAASELTSVSATTTGSKKSRRKRRRHLFRRFHRPAQEDQPSGASPLTRLSYS